MRGTRAWPPTGLIPWFSKTEGNTYTNLLHHPLLFGEIQRSAQEVARRISGAVAGEAYTKSSQDLTPDNEPFMAPLPGSLRTSQDIPSTHHKLLSLASHYFHLPLVFLSPTSPLPFYSPSLSRSPLFRLFLVCLCVGLLACHDGST